MDEAQVQILIEAKNLAGPALVEARAFATQLREAIQTLNRATADGIPVNQAMRQALGELARGMLETDMTAKQQAEAMRDMRHAMTRYIEVVSAGMAPQEAQLAIFDQYIAELKIAKDATNDLTVAQQVNRVAGGAGGGFGLGTPVQDFFGRIGGIGLPGMIAATTLALGPFVAALTAAVVITTSFLVSGGAMVTLLGSMSLGFMGLGGALVLLADKTGHISGAINQFKADFTSMADHLGKAAAPAATQILKFLEGLMPLAQREGTGIIEWFQARLPTALSAMSVAIRNLAPDLNGFGRFLGQVFDRLSPQIAPMFEAVARVGIGAFQGLISNLAALTEWFQQRLPTYGPIIQQIFSGVGGAVQFVAQRFGDLSDWFAAHWPTISKDAQDMSDKFKSVFNALHVVGAPSGFNPGGLFNGLAAAAAIVLAILVDVSSFLTIIVQQASAALPSALQQIAVNIANWQPPGWLAWLFAWDSGGSIKFPGTMSMPGPANFASAAHQRPGITGHGGGGNGNGHRITINVNGSSNPQAAARAVATVVRRLAVS